jgi:tetratricopeptide (TPR) repeat protein
MRYLKNLVPAEHKVLPDYFQAPLSKKGAKQQKPSLLYTLISIGFFIAAICCIQRFLIAILLGIVGWLFTTKGKNWFENKLLFRLTNRIRWGFSAFLMVLTLPLLGYYNYSDAEKAQLQELARQKQAKFTADSLKNEVVRKDSLHFYLFRINKEDPQEAFAMLKNAQKFAVAPQEVDTFKQIKKVVSRRFAKTLVKKGQKKAALVVYNGLLEENPKDGDLLYDRANYFIKVGNMKAAVADLATSIETGNTLASKLYNRVNPIRRKVAYYVTRCCDGTTSNATGRGACSWHGGVCNWNEPVYEEYRKY